MVRESNHRHYLLDSTFFSRINQNSFHSLISPSPPVRQLRSSKAKVVHGALIHPHLQPPVVATIELDIRITTTPTSSSGLTLRGSLLDLLKEVLVHLTGSLKSLTLLPDLREDIRRCLRRFLRLACLLRRSSRGLLRFNDTKIQSRHHVCELVEVF